MRPFLALSCIHSAGRTSQPPRSKPLRGLNHYICGFLGNSRSPKASHNKAGRSDLRNQRFEPDIGKMWKMRKVLLTPESEEMPQSENAEKPRKMQNKLGWHVCRTKSARNLFFQLRIFSRKMLRFFPEIFEPLFCGSEKNPRKIPAKIPTKFPSQIKNQKNSPTRLCRSAGGRTSETPRPGRCGKCG